MLEPPHPEWPEVLWIEETLPQETARRIHRAWDGEGPVPARTEEGALLVWEHIYGHLRGRVPRVIPYDLMGVSVSAGLRICKGMAATGTMFIDNGNYQSQADFAPWSGFLLPEKIILNRYRRRTA